VAEQTPSATKGPRTRCFAFDQQLELLALLSRHCKTRSATGWGALGAFRRIPHSSIDPSPILEQRSLEDFKLKCTRDLVLPLQAAWHWLLLVLLHAMHACAARTAPGFPPDCNSEHLLSGLANPERSRGAQDQVLSLAPAAEAAGSALAP